MGVGAWLVGAEVMGFEVTKTVIWLGEIVLDEAGICMREWTLATGLELGFGLETTTELELVVVLTIGAELA